MTLLQLPIHAGVITLGCAAGMDIPDTQLSGLNKNSILLPYHIWWFVYPLAPFVIVALKSAALDWGWDPQSCTALCIWKSMYIWKCIVHLEMHVHLAVHVLHCTVFCLPLFSVDDSYHNARIKLHMHPNPNTCGKTGWVL